MNPRPPSKTRLKRRLAASGWTVRKPQKWLTIYEDPHGYVKIRDCGRPCPGRYLVVTLYKGRWVASHEASNFDEAVRVAIQDLGLAQPL